MLSRRTAHVSIADKQSYNCIEFVSEYWKSLLLLSNHWNALQKKRESTSTTSVLWVAFVIVEKASIQNSCTFATISNEWRLKCCEIFIIVWIASFVYVFVEFRWKLLNSFDEKIFAFSWNFLYIDDQILETTCLYFVHFIIEQFFYGQIADRKFIYSIKSEMFTRLFYISTASASHW